MIPRLNTELQQLQEQQKKLQELKPKIEEVRAAEMLKMGDKPVFISVLNSPSFLTFALKKYQSDKLLWRRRRIPSLKRRPKSGRKWRSRNNFRKS